MLRPFAHPVACLRMLFRVVGSCSLKFETGQTFRRANGRNQPPKLLGQQCWELLRAFASCFTLILLLDCF